MVVMDTADGSSREFPVAGVIRKTGGTPSSKMETVNTPAGAKIFCASSSHCVHVHGRARDYSCVRENRRSKAVQCFIARDTFLPFSLRKRTRSPGISGSELEFVYHPEFRMTSRRCTLRRRRR